MYQGRSVKGTKQQKGTPCLFESLACQTCYVLFFLKFLQRVWDTDPKRDPDHEGDPDLKQKDPDPTCQIKKGQKDLDPGTRESESAHP